MKTYRFMIFISGLFATFQAIAAPMPCYTKSLQQHRPAVTTTVLVLVDASTTIDAGTEKDFRAAIDAITKRPANIVLMSYAGHAAGQALHLIDRWTMEPALTNEEIIQDVVISAFKEHKRCIDQQKRQAKTELTAALDTLFMTMPIATERSEIVHALSSTLKEFADPDQSTQVLHLSDGLQNSKGRSFYQNKLPRSIDPIAELSYFAKEPTTSPKKLPGYSSVIWYGMLATPAPAKNGKPEYLDGKTIGAFRSFWTQFLASQGVHKVQIGTPTLLNPDLSLPARGPQ